MSENQPPNDPIIEADIYVDPILQFWVKIANENPETPTFGITINVGGILISGNLISYKKYFTAITSDLRLDKNVFISSNDDELPKPDPQHIHLEDAKFYYAGQPPIPNNRGVYWRGKLTSIDGFVIGSLSIGDTK